MVDAEESVSRHILSVNMDLWVISHSIKYLATNPGGH